MSLESYPPLINKQNRHTHNLIEVLQEDKKVQTLSMYQDSSIQTRKQCTYQIVLILLVSIFREQFWKNFQPSTACRRQTPHSQPLVRQYQLILLPSQVPRDGIRDSRGIPRILKSLRMAGVYVD